MNLDGSYFRNEAILATRHNCSGYKSLQKYSLCTEDQVKDVKMPTQKEIDAEMEKRKAAEAEKKKQDAAKKAAAEATAPAPAAEAFYGPGI